MKRLISIFMAFVLVVSLSGCSKKDAEQDLSEDGELSGKVVIWSWDVAAKSLEEAAKEFQKEHPNVEFEIEDLGNSQVYDKLTTRLASNTGLPDVVTVEGGRVTSFASKFPNGFMDLTDHVNEEDFLPVKIGECKVDGKLRAFPWDGAPAAMFYREDLFKEAGIDVEEIKTWADFIEAGKIMDEKIGVKIAPLAAARETTLYRIILNQFGTGVFDDNYELNLDSEESIKTMEIVKEMYDAGITYDNNNWDGLVTASKEGKVATVTSAVWWAGTLQDECQETAGKWRVMKLPLVEEGAEEHGAAYGGSNIMIPEAAENKRAALEFVKFAMTDKENQVKAFSTYGLYPSYIPTYDDPVFDEEVEYFGGQKIWRLFTELGETIPEPRETENSDEALDNLKNAQARILLEGADVKGTMESLQEELLNKFGD